LFLLIALLVVDVAKLDHTIFTVAAIHHW